MNTDLTIFVAKDSPPLEFPTDALLEIVNLLIASFLYWYCRFSLLPVQVGAHLVSQLQFHYVAFQPWLFCGFIAPALLFNYGLFCRAWIWTVVFVHRIFWLCVLRRTHLGWLLELCVAWFLRGSKAPPHVQRAETILDATIPMVGLAETRGIAFSQAANVAHASVTAGGLSPTRLRRRARWAGALQDYLGGRPGIVGELVKGRWTPDLPSPARPLVVNNILGILDGEVKLLGGGVLPCDDLFRHEPFLVCEIEGRGRQVIVPNLLGRLCRGTFGRERDASLLAQLRSRAVEWCSEAKLPQSLVPLLVPNHVALALIETAPERLAREMLEEDGFPLSPVR